MKRRDKVKALLGMSVEELNRELVRLKRSVFFLSCRRANGQVEKLSEVRALRKDVARAMSVLVQRVGAPSASVPVAGRAFSSGGGGCARRLRRSRKGGHLALASKAGG